MRSITNYNPPPGLDGWNPIGDLVSGFSDMIKNIGGAIVGKGGILDFGSQGMVNNMAKALGQAGGSLAKQGGVTVLELFDKIGPELTMVVDTVWHIPTYASIAAYAGEKMDPTKITFPQIKGQGGSLAMLGDPVFVPKPPMIPDAPPQCLNRALHVMTGQFKMPKLSLKLRTEWAKLYDISYWPYLYDFALMEEMIPATKKSILGPARPTRRRTYLEYIFSEKPIFTGKWAGVSGGWYATGGLNAKEVEKACWAPGVYPPKMITAAQWIKKYNRPVAFKIPTTKNWAQQMQYKNHIQLLADKLPPGFSSPGTNIWGINLAGSGSTAMSPYYKTPPEWVVMQWAIANNKQYAGKVVKFDKDMKSLMAQAELEYLKQKTNAEAAQAELDALKLAEELAREGKIGAGADVTVDEATLINAVKADQRKKNTVKVLKGAGVGAAALVAAMMILD